MTYDRKSEIQMRIEDLVTDDGGYQKIPYSRIFGQRKALDQWLKFSNFGIVYSLNVDSETADDTPLIPYLHFYFENKVIPEITSWFVQILSDLSEISKLEAELMIKS